MAQPAIATARSPHDSGAVAGLARFFPEATPVRIPVHLARLIRQGNARPGDSQPGDSASLDESRLDENCLDEKTIIEFGTPREVLFACSTPLEFADVVRLRTSDGALEVEASVVAVQYHPSQTVIAARFLKEVPNWIVKS